jgi:hypothetical protein
MVELPKYLLAGTNLNLALPFQIKCADCDCLPSDCMNSPNRKECGNCKLEECCCWEEIHGLSSF